MAKSEWGTKRLCQHCGTKFYDFQRSPIVCPKCETRFDPESLLKSRRGNRNATVAKTVKPAERTVELTSDEDEDIAVDDDDEIDVTVEGADDDLPEADEDDDGLLEDASDLGEGDDVGDVVITADDED